MSARWALHYLVALVRPSHPAYPLLVHASAMLTHDPVPEAAGEALKALADKLTSLPVRVGLLRAPEHLAALATHYGAVWEMPGESGIDVLVTHGAVRDTGHVSPTERCLVFTTTSEFGGDTRPLAMISVARLLALAARAG